MWCAYPTILRKLLCGINFTSIFVTNCATVLVFAVSCNLYYALWGSRQGPARRLNSTFEKPTHVLTKRSKTWEQINNFQTNTNLKLEHLPPSAVPQEKSGLTVQLYNYINHHRTTANISDIVWSMSSGVWWCLMVSGQVLWCILFKL